MSQEMRWVGEMIPHLSGHGNGLGIGVHTTQACIQGQIRPGVEVVTNTQAGRNSCL